MNLNKDAIIDILEKENWNFSKFALELGISRATVSRVMNGQRSPSGVFISAFKKRFPKKSIDKYFFA